MAETIDFSAALPTLYPALNAASSGDLIWWTTDELYAWVDECVRRLARGSGVFVVYDYLSIVTFPSQASYTLPSNHVTTIQAEVGGMVLEPANVREIEALDNDWTTAVGTPRRFLQDTAGLNSITLYPAPNNAYSFLPLGLVMHSTPANITSGNPTLNAPICLTEYFLLYALSEARKKETKAAMPEIADWCGQIVGLYDQVITAYWGPGQP